MDESIKIAEREKLLNEVAEYLAKDWCDLSQEQIAGDILKLGWDYGWHQSTIQTVQNLVEKKLFPELPERRKPMNHLEIHDEKRFGFWGGLTDSNTNEDVAAIVDSPDAPELARLFAVSPGLFKAAQILLEPLESLVEGVIGEWDEAIANLRASIDEIKGEKREQPNR